MPSIEDCGPYPAASGFADSYVDGNGATIYSPLTPEQNARYLAAVSAHQQCLGQAQGTPPCPLGEYFYGSYQDGRWLGQCVSTYTGQPTTPVVVIPAEWVPGTQPPSPYKYAPAGSLTPAPAPPIVTPTPGTTPAAVTTPASTPVVKTPLQPKDAFDGGGGFGGLDSYCEFFPDDPYCLFGSTLGGLLGGLGGGGTSVTTIVQQSGLLASDVHGIVNDALSGLWAVVVGVLDLGLRGAIAAVQNAVTALGNALKAAWNILSRLSGMILKFLGQMWFTVLHGVVRALGDLFGWLQQLYKNVLKPGLQLLKQVRAKILDIWKRFVVPFLIVIQDIRKVLAILSVFHIKWAAKLDAQLADLERKITAPLIQLLSYINHLANWMNLLVTAGYLIQKPLWLNTLKAYSGSTISLQLNALNQPLTPAKQAAAQAAFNAPTAQQSRADLKQFLQSGSGSMAAPIAGAHSAFDTFIRENS